MGFRIPSSAGEDLAAKKVESESLNAAKELSDLKLIEAPIDEPSKVEAPIEESTILREPASSKLSSEPQEQYTNKGPIPEENMYDLLGPEPKQVDTNAPISEAELNNLASNPVDTLHSSRVSARSVDMVQAKNLLDIAEKLNISTDEAAFLLGEHPVEELKAMPELANIQKDYPGVTTWARNPENYRLLQEDPLWAKKLESGATKISGKKEVKKSEYSDEFNAFMSGLNSFNSSLVSAPAFVYDVFNTASNAISKQLPALGLDTNSPPAPDWLRNNAARKYFDEQAKFYSTQSIEGDAGQVILDNVSKGDFSEAGRQIYLRMINGAPVNAFALMGGIVPKVGMGVATVLGLTSGLSAQEEALKKGADYTSSTLDGVYNAAFELIFERLENLTIFKHWEESLAKKYGADTAKKVLKNTARNFIYTATVEGGSEGLTTLAQAYSSVATGTDPKAADDILVKMLGSTIMGGVSGVTMSAPSAAISARVQIENKATVDGLNKRIREHLDQARKSYESKKKMSEMRKDKETHKTSTENPQKTEELAKEVSNKKKEVVEPKTAEPKAEEVKNVEDIVHDPEDIPSSENNTSTDINKEFENDMDNKDLYVTFDIREFNSKATDKEMLSDVLAEEALGPEGLKAFRAARANGGTIFKVPWSEYHRYSDAHADLDNIAIFGDNRYNGTQGEDILKTVSSEESPTVSYNTIVNEGEEPSAPEDIIFHNPETDPVDGDPVLREVRLVNKERDIAHKAVYDSILASVKRSAVALEHLGPEFAEHIANVQYGHLVFRSEVLGKPIEEINREVTYGYDSKLGYRKEDQGTLAYFSSKVHEIAFPRNKIIFGKNIKANAVIHEFAHSWLHNMMIDYAYISGLQERTADQEDYFKAMEEAAKLFKLKNIGELANLRIEDFNKNHGKKQKVAFRASAIHETFAQTAEKFFLEGKGGKGPLARSMNALRKWMQSIASIIGKAYPQYPPLVISPEVTRIFQTILGGMQKVAEKETEMFPPARFSEKILGKNYEQYLEALKDARDTAISQMYARFYNMTFKEREAAIDKALDTIYDEASAKINGMPSVVAYNTIKEKGPEYRITQESILEIAEGNVELAKAIKEAAPREVIAGKKKAGTDIRDLMLDLKISKVEDVVKMFQEMSNIDGMIESEAQKVIDETFPMFKSDEDLHKETVAAINNEGRSKVLGYELKALAKLHLQKMQKMSGFVAKPTEKINRDLNKILKNKAFVDVMGVIARTLKPMQYRDAQIREGSEASKKLAKGDYEKALEHKQLEAQNFHSFNIARKLLVEMESINALMKRLLIMKPEEFANKYDYDLISHAKNLVAALNTGSQLPIFDANNSPNSSIYDYSTLKSIGDLINVINGVLAQKNALDFTVEEFLTFGALLNSVVHKASSAKKAEIEGVKESVEDIASDAKAEIGGRLPGDPVISMGTNGGMFQMWGAQLISFRTLLSGLYKSDEEFTQSTLGKVFNSVDRAVADLMLSQEKDSALISKAVSNISENNPEMQSILDPVKRRYDRLFGAVKGRPVAASYLNHVFNNKAEIIQMMLYLGSESGRQKFALGGLILADGSKSGPLGFFDPADGEFKTPLIDMQIEEYMRAGVITEQDIQFLQTVWDIYESHYAKLKKSVRKILGYDIGKIEARSFSTPWGEVKGGYVPLTKNKIAWDTSEQTLNFNIDNPGTFIRDLFPVTNTSMAKRRSRAAAPLSLDLSMLNFNLNSVYRVAYLAPQMGDLGKVFNNPDLMKAIETRRPGAYKAIIKPWFNRTMAQEYSAPIRDKNGEIVGSLATVDRFASALRANNRILAFGLNYATWAKQYIGLVPASLGIDERYLLKAANNTALDITKTRNIISQNSKRMKIRMESNELRAVKSLDDFMLHDDWISKGNAIVNDIVYIPIQFAQNHVDMIIYSAAILKAQELGIVNTERNPNAVDDYAYNAVIQSQSSSNIHERPNILHGPEIQKLWTDFSSVFIAMHGLLYKTKVRNAYKEKEIEKLKAYLFVLGLIGIVAPIAEFIIGHPIKTFKALRGDSDANMDVVSSVGSNALNVVAPITGRNVLALASGNAFNFAPATASLASATKGTVKALNPLAPGNGEIDFKEVKAILDMAALVGGIPTTIITRPTKLIIDLNKK